MLLLAGCGSSHHDSPTSASISLTPGIYRGTLNLTVTGPGGVSQSSPGPIVMTLNSNGTVQVGQFPPVSLQGNNFTATVPFTSFNQNPQLHCTSGTFGINGTFSGPSVAGSPFSNGLVCNGFAFVITGSYTAQLSATELPSGAREDDVLDLARKTLERHLRP